MGTRKLGGDGYVHDLIVVMVSGVLSKLIKLYTLNYVFLYIN